MTERERLVGLIETAVSIMQNTPEKLADYLLEHGVICPPCKVGEGIFALAYGEELVIPFTINSLDRIVAWEKAGEFGRNLFLTREEAEAELERRRSNAKKN